MASAFDIFRLIFAGPDIFELGTDGDFKYFPTSDEQKTRMISQGLRSEFVSGSMRFSYLPKRKRKGLKMVGAISSASLISTTSTVGSSGSSAQIASLEAQITAKQKELEDAKTDDAKTEINDEITQLQAKLKAQEAAEAKKAQTQQTAAANGQSGQQEPASLIGTRNFEDGAQFGSRQIWI